MVFKLFIDKNCEEEVTATVHERTPLIDEIERIILQNNITEQIPGYEEDSITMVPISAIECFFVENEKTYAHCISGKQYLIKTRNMLFLMDSIALGKEKWGLPEKEDWKPTHFIR